LINQERFSKKTWDNADLDERMKILQEFYDESQKIMGTDAEPNINFEEVPNINGQYSPTTNTVTIPPSRITASDGYIRLKTVMHELRHCYQWESVEDPDAHIVDEDTRKAWKDNWYNYVDSNADRTGYYQQPIEWDAFNFATQYDRVQIYINGNNNYQGSWDQTWRNS
jgi:hypothetical protein